MAVRYDKKFKEEIHRIITAYNRKISRLANKGYTLPPKITKYNVVNLRGTTRKEVRRHLKDLEAFTKRGGEKNITVKGATLPRYLYENIKRYARLLKVQTTRKMKELETRKPIVGTTKQPFTFSQYGSQEYLTLKAKRMTLLDKDLSKMTPSEISTYLEKLKVNTRQRDLGVWQENYIQILEDSALSYGYDPDKLEVIVERLKKLSPSDFDDLSFINRNIKEIVYYYRALENIETADELKDVGEDVITNLDSIYENLDEILADYE